MFELGVTGALISFTFCSCSLTISILQCWATLWSLHGGEFPVYSACVVSLRHYGWILCILHVHFSDGATTGSAWWKGKSPFSFGTSISVNPLSLPQLPRGGTLLGGLLCWIQPWKLFCGYGSLPHKHLGTESIAVHLAVQRRREGIYGNLLCSWSLIFMPLLMMSSSNSAAWVTIPPLYVFCIYSYFLLKFLGKKLSKDRVENFVLK